ncbi:hypothetical protein BLNAU_9827 [Blattamonas nauphoetae]|uniref:UBX domain-containing protein n=1 Tax=Blattamonas nauphoetae TaxID=2049346 RepID=A0ABQ9XUW8_9EUKA|nr:hypothetical protein BLNAU_9827 [Blattamonas nauphoetae]
MVSIAGTIQTLSPHSPSLDGRHTLLLLSRHSRTAPTARKWKLSMLTISSEMAKHEHFSSLALPDILPSGLTVLEDWTCVLWESTELCCAVLVSAQGIIQPRAHLQADLLEDFSPPVFLSFFHTLLNISTNQPISPYITALSSITPPLPITFSTASLGQTLFASQMQRTPLCIVVTTEQSFAVRFSQTVLCAEGVREVTQDQLQYFGMLVTPEQAQTLPYSPSNFACYIVSFSFPCLNVHGFLRTKEAMDVDLTLVNILQALDVRQTEIDGHRLNYTFASLMFDGQRFDVMPEPGMTAERLRLEQEERERKQQELEEERMIIESTNAEYEESMLIDKAKEESMKEEQARLFRMMEEEKEAKQKQKELDIERERQKNDQLTMNTELTKAAFVEEPDEATPADQLCTLQIRLPPPARPVVRRFLVGHTIANLLAVVRTLDEELMGKTIHAVSLPRRRLDDHGQTLESAGLCPRSAVLIEVEEDEDDVGDVEND